MMVGIVRSEQVTFLAAGIAYYAFVSLIPLTLLALVVLSYLGGTTLAETVIADAGAILTPSAQELLRVALAAHSGRGGATVTGLVVLAWSSIKVFRGLDKAFSAVYGTVEVGSFLDELRDAVAALGGLGLGILGITVATALVALVASPLVDYFAPVILFVMLVVAFLPMYYLFPDKQLSGREVLPGAILAATGWWLLGAGFQIYATAAGSYALYGILGAVLLVLTWLYAGAMLVMLGAVLNAVIHHRQFDLEDVDPDDVADALDRQLQHPSPQQDITRMTDEDDERRERRDTDLSDADEETLRAEVQSLRDELDEFEADIEERTVDRDAVEADLKRYVRRRLRRGHARGWGPYLVLLYGTVMTLGAFTYLDGGWAVLAMVVVWLSTLGLYVLMVLFGAGISALSIPGRIRDALGDRRS